MALTQDQKKHFRKLAHHLKPVVMLSENGLSEGVLTELNRALEDHELIKVKVSAMDREDLKTLVSALCSEAKADLVQLIGKIAVIYRPAKKQNPKLSNLVRYQNQ